MQKLAVTATLFFMFYHFAASTSDACSCVPDAFAPVCQMIGRTQVAFVGRSMEFIRTGPNSGNFRFKVEKVYKGLDPATKEVIVWAGGGTSCATGYAVGGRFLIFSQSSSDANGSDHKVVFSAMCSGSRQATESDVGFLDDYLAGKTQTYVTGRVLQSTRSWDYPSYRDATPVPGAEVVLSNGSNRITARSASDGTFVFSLVPPGEYSVSSSLYPFRPFAGSDTIFVQKGTCAYVFPELRANSFIEGRILDNKGEAVEGVRVRAFRRDATGDWREPPQAWAYSGADGQFRLTDIDSGDYVLGVETYKDGPSDDSPFPPVYLPGVPTRDNAQILTVEPQKGIRGLTFKLLPRHTPRRVTIQIVNADGTPIGSNLLQLFSRNGLVRNFGKEFNEGREFETGFRFKAFAEREYVFKARYWVDNLSSDVDNKRLLLAETVILKPGKDPAEILLRLSKQVREDDQEFKEY